MKKKFTSIFLALSLTLILVACSSNGDDKSSDAIYKSGTYKASEVGYNQGQPIEIAVTVSDNKIEKIDVEKEDETDGVGKQAIETLIKSILDKQSTEVDLVSSATLTSEALIKAVNSALKEASTK